MQFLQITNDPALARRCDALPGMRLFVDLERQGKAERQSGRNTFLSTHVMDDVGRIKAVLRQAPLMVRLNPLHVGTRAEVDAALAQGADRLMLPMFRTSQELAEFAHIVSARVPITALLETSAALHTLPAWIATPGLDEVYVGLNDLHIDLGYRFMFEPLADGVLDRVAQAVLAQGLRFGFGGIARCDEGLLPGQAVLGEHLRLGSQAVILSRTFHREGAPGSFEHGVAQLRHAEHALTGRTASQIDTDRRQVQATVARIVARLREENAPVACGDAA